MMLGELKWVSGSSCKIMGAFGNVEERPLPTDITLVDNGVSGFLQSSKKCVQSFSFSPDGSVESYELPEGITVSTPTGLTPDSMHSRLGRVGKIVPSEGFFLTVEYEDGSRESITNGTGLRIVELGVSGFLESTNVSKGELRSFGGDGRWKFGPGAHVQVYVD